MAASLRRYLITSPATSQAFRDALQEAIDLNGGTFPMTATAVGSDEAIEVIFTWNASRRRGISNEYTGTLADGGIASIKAITHPDYSEEPAEMTLVRRTTP